MPPKKITLLITSEVLSAKQYIKLLRHSRRLNCSAYLNLIIKCAAIINAVTLFCILIGDVTVGD